MANFLRKLFGLDDETTISRAGGLSEGMLFARQRAVESGDTEAVQAIDNGTYKELLEQRAAKRQASAPAGYEIVRCDIAGINYRKGIADYVGESTGYLNPQPSNRHDPNAIAIYAADRHHLGYIREYETDSVRALHLRFPLPVSIYIEECYDDDENRRFFVGEVTIKYKKKMKKILLFAVAAILLASCTKKQSFNPKTIAEQCMREHAYHPDELKVLSCTATLIPDTTIVSTSYHIAAVDGEPINDRSWRNVTAVYTDSVRISHVHKPEHYYCYATIECMNDCGETVQGTGEVAVFPDGSAIMYRNFRDRYYQSVIDTVYAQQDTLTDVRENIGFLPDWNGWVVRQMLLNFINK